MVENMKYVHDSFGVSGKRTMELLIAPETSPATESPIGQYLASIHKNRSLTSGEVSLLCYLAGLAQAGAFNERKN
jgi:hypothetical protein